MPFGGIPLAFRGFLRTLEEVVEGRPEAAQVEEPHMPVKREREVYVIVDEEDRHPPTPGSALKDPPQGSIARRAFELYLARGAVHGRDVQDWLQAERELRGV
jgi:hypothetical protein